MELTKCCYCHVTIVFALCGIIVIITTSSSSNSLSDDFLEGRKQDADTTAPCIYEGHLKTDSSWFGYLANISIVNTARMTFEFSYPAERCCQNILFYSEDQASIISARMNCWQKEYLLRPEDDQILRLTPRFSWSGCHMTHPNGASTYVCEGGRSFTVEQQQYLLKKVSRSSAAALSEASHVLLSKWYVAVSNCATLHGLDLQYRLVVYGHVGDCRSRTIAEGRSGSAQGAAHPTNPRSVLQSLSASAGHSSFSSDLGTSSGPKVANDAVCVVDGHLNSTGYWYGFIVNASFVRGGGFRYRFSYPFHMQTQKVLLYSEEDARKLRPNQTCLEREGVFRFRNAREQILELGFRSSWNGCISGNRNSTMAGRTLLCQGERRYDSARTALFALSNCQSTNGLILEYHLEIYGYSNTLCSFARYYAGSLKLTVLSSSSSSLLLIAELLLQTFY